MMPRAASATIGWIQRPQSAGLGTITLYAEQACTKAVRDRIGRPSSKPHESGPFPHTRQPISWQRGQRRPLPPWMVRPRVQGRGRATPSLRYGLPPSVAACCCSLHPQGNVWSGSGTAKRLTKQATRQETTRVGTTRIGIKDRKAVRHRLRLSLPLLHCMLRDAEPRSPVLFQYRSAENPTFQSLR